MGHVKQLLALLSIYVVCLSRVAADAQCNEADRKALLKLKAGITEDPVGLMSTWEGPDCCNGNWNGVGCDLITGKVTMIDLRSWDPWNTTFYMVGTLSKSIGDLNELVYIRLTGWKRITGKIPNSIARLLHLDTLDLSRNNFTGKLPSWIPRLTKLRILRLGGNRLRGHIPHFNNSRLLQILDLDFNQIHGSIPSSIGTLTDLNTLDLSLNGLTGKIPDEMLNLTNLNQLDLSYNHLCGKIPQGKPLNEFPVSSYSQNKCLCGLPLGPC